MASILESQDEIPFGVHDLIEGKIDKDGRKSAVAAATGPLVFLVAPHPGYLQA